MALLGVVNGKPIGTANGKIATTPHEMAMLLMAPGIWHNHVQTGEPLSEVQVEAVDFAGLASKDDFDMRGGNLWWNSKIWPDEEC